MRTGIVVEVTAAERDRLEAIVADRNSPQKHVWRAGIVLATADGLGTVAIMRHTAKSKTVVWRWQERFAQEGVDGLLRDKTRPSRVKPFGPEVAERIVALTLAEPPGETTHWTGRAMAKVTGVSLSYVQRVWRSHGLQPHRIRTFKLSNDPEFAAKVRDIVGLYVDPPAHAVVLSVDEKRGGRADRGSDARRTAGRNDPLDRPRDGESHGREPVLRPARLALARASASPMAHTRGSPRLYASNARTRASPSILSVFARRRRRDVAIEAGSTTWLSTPSS